MGGKNCVAIKNTVNTYLFLTDLLEDVVFESLFHPSQRHMPIIFGNILTEAIGGQIRKKDSLIHFSYRITNDGNKSHYLSI